MIRLLLLPFMLVKKILWLFLWHFIYFFICRPKLLFVVAAFLVLGGAWFMKNYEPSPQFVPTTQQITLPALKHTPIDSGGRFAKDIASTLDENNRPYYAGHYQHAMTHTADGQNYLWVAHESFFGRITPSNSFTSKRGNKCRNFSELLHAPHAAHTRRGIACMRANGAGWCRLPEKAIPNCEIGFGGNDGVLDKVKGLF